MASNGKNTRVKTIPVKEHQYLTGECYVAKDTFFKEITLAEILFTTDRDPQGSQVLYITSVFREVDSEDLGVEEEVHFELCRNCELKFFTKISKEDYLRYRIDPSGKWKEKS